MGGETRGINKRIFILFFSRRLGTLARERKNGGCIKSVEGYYFEKGEGDSTF